MDELIRQYAERLQQVYDQRTAGDYSFRGILSEFLEEIVKSPQAVTVLNHRQQAHFNSNAGALEAWAREQTEVMELVSRNKRIEAIKELRHLRPELGLKGAYDLVNLIAAS